MRTAMERAAEAYPQIQLDAYTGDLEAGVAIVQQTPPNTYHCVISRGGTAALIRKVTDLPVVDINISVYDVLRTMKLAQNYTSVCHRRVSQYHRTGAHTVQSVGV